MPKHRRIWNQDTHNRYLREGRGCGSGPGYIPWIRVQDFASQGVVSRVKGRTTGRVHHLMSNNELAYFYMLDWSENVLDIREQYPLLDLDCALYAAAHAGIKYPTDRISGYPYVLTCDFMVTTASGLKARTIKMSSELNKSRVLEKLEIERRYWLTHGVDWKLVTENEISYRKAKNIEWLYSAQDFIITEDTPGEIKAALELLLRMVCCPEHSIIEVAQIVEDRYSLAKGVGLLLFKYLALNKEIELDLNSLNLNTKGAAVAA